MIVSMKQRREFHKEINLEKAAVHDYEINSTETARFWRILFHEFRFFPLYLLA